MAGSMSVLGLSKIGIAIYALSALVPLSKSDEWWIRIFDFPRLQLLALGLVFGAISLVASQERKVVKAVWLTLLMIAAGIDLYRVLPYTPAWQIESLPSLADNKSRSFSLIVINVLQGNEESHRLLEIVDKKSPDMVFVLEVNERWMKDLAPLESKYRFRLQQAQDNTYGLALYSKLPLENPEIRFLIEPEVPSIRTVVILPSGDRIEVYGLHPRPPNQKAGPTTERDAELIQVAKTVRGGSTPVVVMGDLNDVAWSHTTRLFRRVSGLLDPRVGRAPFATFPVQLPFFRFPLDYVFHSASFTLNSLERLETIGSDHFPIFVSLALEPSVRDSQSGPKIEDGDMKEADETARRAKE